MDPVSIGATAVHPGRLVGTMKAAVFVEPGRIELRQVPIPTPGPGDALLRVTTTTTGATP